MLLLALALLDALWMTVASVVAATGRPSIQPRSMATDRPLIPNPIAAIEAGLQAPALSVHD